MFAPIRTHLANSFANRTRLRPTPVSTRALSLLQRPHRLGALQRRLYATGEKPQMPNEEKLRTRAAIGPFTLRALGLFAVTGAGLFYYFQMEKERVKRRREEQEANATKSIGKPKIGGPFELLDCRDGKTVTDKDFLGRYLLVYFGFTHCPDICPDELDKLSEAVDMINTDTFFPQPLVTPIFISCDPLRDTVPVVRAYVRDFHPSLVGLTGAHEAVARVAKSYRVYISTPSAIQDGEDYLVDHSIFFYLMDPEGKFVDCYPKDSTAKEIAQGVKKYAEEYLAQGGKVEGVVGKVLEKK